MTGHMLRIAGRYVTYFASGEQLLPGESEAIGFDFAEDAGLRARPCMRRVLTTLIRPESKIYGVLHWSDGSDLAVLDQKVRDGTVEDDDFGTALFAEPRTITCRSYGAQVRVLAVDTGQPLFSADRAERLRAHALKAVCPVCGEPLGVLVVEFIGW
jgi:hypothetical protein